MISSLTTAVPMTGHHWRGVLVLSIRIAATEPLKLGLNPYLEDHLNGNTVLSVEHTVMWWYVRILGSLKQKKKSKEDWYAKKSNYENKVEILD